MSNDFNGPPSGMAVRHLVCVFEGAPGPVQEAATAMPGPASATSPNNAGASTLDIYEVKFDFIEFLPPESRWLLIVGMGRDPSERMQPPTGLRQPLRIL